VNGNGSDEFFCEAAAAITLPLVKKKKFKSV